MDGQMTDDNPRRIPSAVLAPGVWLAPGPSRAGRWMPPWRFGALPPSGFMTIRVWGEVVENCFLRLQWYQTGQVSKGGLDFGLMLRPAQ